MAKITIDRERCKGCFLCISVCPRGLIRVDDKLNRKGIKPVKFSSDKSPRVTAGDRKCLGCAMCALICPDCCIEVWK